jgi:hypothetical protein
MSEEQEKYEMAKKIYAETFAAMAGRLMYRDHTPYQQDIADVARELTEVAVKEFYDWHWPHLLRSDNPHTQEYSDG